MAKLLTRTFAVALALCSTPSAFAVTSVPVNTVRPLTEENIKAAVTVCYQSLMQKLFVQVFQPKGSASLRFETHFSWTGWRDTQAEVPWFPYTYVHLQTPGLFGGDTLPLGGDAKRNRINFNSNGGSVWDVHSGDTALSAQGKLPTVYSTPAYAYSYNGLGNVASVRRLVSNVRIEGDFGQFSFVNDVTRRPVAYTLNTAEYGQCLQQELQNSAGNN